MANKPHGNSYTQMAKIVERNIIVLLNRRKETTIKQQKKEFRQRDKIHRTHVFRVPASCLVWHLDYLVA